MKFIRHAKTAGKKMLHRFFMLGQRAGVDILPRHFYSEIPDIRRLAASTDWRRPFTLAGVAGSSIDEQCARLREMCPAHVTAELHDRDIHSEACSMNGQAGFGPIEAECLYAYVRHRMPAKILQIGCGVSTGVCVLAARDARYTPEIICVEPYPTQFLKKLSATGSIRLLEIPAQSMPLDVVDGLGENSLFFVDSTHTLGPAGEVTWIILEMLPRLAKGSCVHFHDIRFPYDYDRRLLSEALFFQHESPLLHAFLSFNSRFRVDVSMSMLHYMAPHVLKQCFPRYVPAGNSDGLQTSPGHFPSSLYASVVA